MPHPVDHPKCITAAASRLEELGCSIVHTSHYYFYSPTMDKVSKEEAFIQTIKITPENPRIFRLLRDAIKDKSVKKGVILYYAKKYSVEAIIE